MTVALAETRLGLIHRVIEPDNEYPREYAILVTDQRSIFIRLKKTRSNLVLRQEMRFGTALVTDVAVKTLEDFEKTALETLSMDSENFVIPHESVTALSITADSPQRRRRDFFVWWVMKHQKEIFQVYNLEMKYRQERDTETALKFYAVPLGAYFKPRRQVQTREMILREYAMEVLGIYRSVLPEKIAVPKFT